MAIQLSEGVSVKLGNASFKIQMANLDPEGLGVVSTSDAREAIDAYKFNVEALLRVEKAIIHLRNFCAYRAKGLKALTKGHIEDAKEWEQWADKEYNQLPIELKW
jgi:hypothetical protein